MYKPLTLCIALRYLFGKTLDRFITFVSWLSVIGIMLGVLSMIIVLSVMNGFETRLKKNILDFIPHAIVTTNLGNFYPKKEFVKYLLGLKGVNKIEKIIISDVVLQSLHAISFGTMFSVGSNNKEPLEPYFLNVSSKELIPGKYRLIIGERLAKKMKLRVGDKVRLIIPSVLKTTLVGRVPNQRLFTVIGTYSTDTEVDEYEILVNREDASRIMSYPSKNITGWRLWLDDPLNITGFSNLRFPDSMVLKDWREKKGELFQAMSMEKNLMTLLLSMIIIVGVFNIFVSLGLRILEKRAEIAILQVQGLNKRKIFVVFAIQGVFLGFIGSVFGSLFGVLFTKKLNLFLSFLNLFDKDFFLPVEINFLQVMYIILITTFLSFFAIIYPAKQAINTSVSEGLRCE